jgi:hypothetical protein
VPAGIAKLAAFIISKRERERGEGERRGREERERGERRGKRRGREERGEV